MKRVGCKICRAVSDMPDKAVSDLFEGLEKLIIERSSDVGRMRNLLSTIREQVEAHSEREKSVGVTLMNGKSVYYLGSNAYKLLPNDSAPVTIEIRKRDKAKGTYTVVAHAKWTDVSEIHEASS
jgi:hypothetical protein